MADKTPHRCHAIGCEAETDPSMFMCRPHWFALPKPMRDAIWRHYRRGQERDKRPSAAYLEAARDARAYLASDAAGELR